MSNFNQDFLHSIDFHLVIIAYRENSSETEHKEIPLKTIDLQVCIWGLILVKFD